VAIDLQANYDKWLDYPAEEAESVTPDNDTDIIYVSRALYIGGSGNVRVQTKGGQDVTFLGVLAGTLIPIRISRVYAAGTTATNIVSFY
jgi:hypothetical protein